MRPLNKIVAAVQTLFSAVLMLSNAVHSAGAFEVKAEQDTVKKKRSGVIGFPIIFYTPDTKWAGGASGGYYYRESKSDTTARPSTIGATLIYTQRQQIIAGFSADLYWQNDTHHPTGGIGYLKFPDTFYGIGNNTAADLAEDYTHRVITFGMSFQKQVRRGLYLGIHYELGNDKLIEVEKVGLLAKGNILGSKGGTASGAGISVNRDTRNNLFYPSSGGDYGFSVTFFRSTLGSDFDFISYNLGLRKYISIFSSHVLAVQGVISLRTGDTPFQLLSQLGGICGDMPPTVTETKICWPAKWNTACPCGGDSAWLALPDMATWRIN